MLFNKLGMVGPFISTNLRRDTHAQKENMQHYIS